MTKERRPRAEVLKIALRLVERIEESCERIELAGSLRREKPDVGDIEIVAIPKEGVLSRERECDVFGREAINEIRGNLLWSRLDAMGVPYTKRGQKYRQFAVDGVQVDLFTAARGNWGWVYLIRTGSADFSHRMAATLNLRGMTSKDGYVTRGLRRVDTPDEANVFELAGVVWTDPKFRDR